MQCQMRVLPRGKLVRDRIIMLKISEGERIDWLVLNHAEYRRYLAIKALEEAGELAASTTREEIIEELADVVEVLRALAASYQSRLWRRGTFPTPLRSVYREAVDLAVESISNDRRKITERARRVFRALQLLRLDCRITRSEVEAARKKKAVEKGVFRRKLYLYTPEAHTQPVA